MKALAVCLFLLGVLAWYALRPAKVEAQGACDDLCTALINHGVDEMSAPVEAAVAEVVIANNNALLERLNADEAYIITLQNQVQVLCAQPGVTCP